MQPKKTTRAVILVGILLATTACERSMPASERPPAVQVSYEDLTGEDALTDAELNAQLAVGRMIGQRFTTLEEGKFLAGDPVLRRVGNFRLEAVFDPLLRVGIFTVVHNPAGVEGETTTFTAIVGVTEQGLVIRDENGRILQVLQNNMESSPDVGRLIIAKIGDITAAAMNGAVGIGIKADAGAYDASGSGGPGTIAASEGKATNNVTIDLSLGAAAGTGCVYPKPCH